MPDRGAIIGRFNPPHRGHEYLVDFARAFVDELWIFVCTLPDDPIPGHLRFHWMSQLFPDARLVHIEEVNPQANRNHEGAHRIWARAVRDHMSSPPNYIFASEEYGWSFAAELGARFIPVDPSRDQFPVSGTEVRTRPFRHWHHIPQKVRPYFVKRIAVNLPGIPTEKRDEILREAALLLQTLYVPDYCRFYRNFTDPERHPLDAGIARQARQSMTEALARQARFYLLIDGLDTPDDEAVDLVLHFNSTSIPTPGRKARQHLMLQAPTDMIPHVIRETILENYRDLA